MKRKPFFANYVNTYVERDVRQLLNIFAARYQDVCANPTVAYAGGESFTFKGVSVVPFHQL